MNKIINLIAPFLPAKIAIINSILSTMPESTREVELGRIVAKQIPDFHLKLRPYKKNPKPKKQDTSYEDTMAIARRKAAGITTKF